MESKSRLYGRRILHVMSPVRWTATKWTHWGDSNWKVLYKTIKFLPECHHYVLIPENNEMDIHQDNITFVPFPYPISVLANRGYFNYKALRNYFDWRKHDIDFVFLHQPELFYNVMSGLLSDRYGTSVDTFLFFHWVDSPQSKPSETYTEGFWRQIEAIDLSTKTFFHCDASIDYMKSNWKKPRITGEINDENFRKKITHMPLAADPFLKESKPIPLPKKKILLFNHRWNKTTGIKRLIDYTKDLNRDEYLVWVTDKNAKKPSAGAPAPKWMRVESLPSRAEYQYLIENSYATLCFVDSYATWNLSVQDGISLGTNSLVYEHPVMKHIIDDNFTDEKYPLYFKTKEEFLKQLKNLPPFGIDWKLPPHEEIFKSNLISNMVNAIDNYESKRKKEPYSQDGKRLYGREWLWHILNGNPYKKDILYNTHKDLHLSNSWEHLRRWVLMQGVLDDPYSSTTKFEIPDDVKDKILDMLNDDKWIDRSYASEPKRDPKFVRVSKNKFF